MVEIVERDFAAFFETPFRAYGAEAPYVSPMKSDLRRFLSAGINPLFPDEATFTYFTAHKDGAPVGRIVVHSHPQSNALYGTKRACFGFFDCADDETAARMLLDRAQAWASARGYSELAGNFNLTAMQQLGVQTDGFDRAGYTDMVLNPPHIPDLLRANGFEAMFPVSTYELALADYAVRDRPLPDGHRFASIERGTFQARMNDARLVLNDGFSNNPMFVPLTDEEFQFQAGEMTKIMDPRLSSVLLHGNDPVGVVICVPDLNGFLKATRSRVGLMTPFHFLRYRLRRRRAVIIFYSVAKQSQGLGLMGSMLERTLKQLKAARYESLGITWIADENAASLRMMDKIGAKPLHCLHLFRKALS